jgi:hypothetical protein
LLQRHHPDEPIIQQHPDQLLLMQNTHTYAQHTGSCIAANIASI